MFALLSIALTPHRDTTTRSARTATKPNYVTPLLPERYAEAQNASRVHLAGYNTTELYSGFFTIDASTGSNTYFMYSTPVSGREELQPSPVERATMGRCALSSSRLPAPLRS